MEWEARLAHARAPHALPRALTATVATVTGAAAAHTWAGGTVPTGPGLALVAGVVLGASLLVFRRGVPGWALLPAVAAAQLGVHQSFGLVGHHHSDAVPAHAHPAVAATSGWSWQMLAAHVFVAVLVAALWWAGRRAASYAVHLRARSAPPVAVRLVRPAEPPAHSTPVLLLVPPRRGPPPAVLSA
ncbi:hypothetical protein [Nocardioides sp. zg-1228]|uniref:hypothetical protein n=1 Tax=Nocardioides sp. zg-1228 TaxID=2763008 RepID=UPI001642A20D|nr:hypothetical protein [Nocardioides sp. zg-1228]MBC2933830.1 hypothetical protein [Nocardioides sp. zg-1228]QSF58602.1 hypothetical protein JX575_05235 [Nocardioides sp. zg-1228]